MSHSCRKEEDLLYLLIHLQKHIGTKFGRSAGISANRLDLLHKLSLSEEVSQSDLQKTVSIDGAAVTRHLKQLETEGIVVRRRCAG